MTRAAFGSDAARWFTPADLLRYAIRSGNLTLALIENEGGLNA